MTDNVVKLDSAEDHALFLDYHDSSPWSKAKVAAGLTLNPEAREYMRREIAARAERKRLRDEQEAEEKAADDKATQPEVGAVPASVEGERDAGTTDIRGPDNHAA